MGYYIYAEKILPEQQYFIMTRSAAQETGAKLPEVHGVNKPLDPDLKPEKDRGLQKHVLAQPTKIVPTGPVATATGSGSCNSLFAQSNTSNQIASESGSPNPCFTTKNS